VQCLPVGKRREWRLTEAGLALGPVIHQMGEWGVQYAQEPLDESDLDSRVLMWNMRRRVDPTTFPDERVTVEFDFTDMPSSRRHWWLISDHGEVDLCPTDPGFPVDVYLTTDVRTMVMVWFGKLAFDRAVASGRIELLGSASHLQAAWRLAPAEPIGVAPGLRFVANRHRPSPICALLVIQSVRTNCSGHQADLSPSSASAARPDFYTAALRDRH
jgi:hypothetical protein